MGKRKFGHLTGVLGAAVTLAMALLPGVASANGPGVQYKLHFTGGGSEDVMAQDPSASGFDLHQTGTWTLQPTDVNVWLPRFSGPPGSTNVSQTDYVSADGRQNPNGGEPVIGALKETGHYPDYSQTPTVIKSYSCSGSAGYTGVYTHSVIVTALDPTVELETNLGILDSVPHSNVFSHGCGDPKSNITEGFFSYADGDPTGQRLQLGMLIPQQEIGAPFISGPAQDYDNVQTSESAQACEWGFSASACTVSFKLTGDYSLTKVCDGTLSSNGGICGGAGSGAPPAAPPAPTPPPPVPPAPPAGPHAPAPPASTRPKCSGLHGKKLKKCKAAQQRKSAVNKCKKLRKRSKRAACLRRAKKAH